MGAWYKSASPTFGAMNDQPSDQPYRVLARKYRPATFAELIGQEAMVRTLTNAIAADRLPHAFILTGVRGVGKTSTARIMARALNCVGPDGNGGPTAAPCGMCEHCQAIAADRHVDVIEMDAASRTGVNDIRELIDGVRYRPVDARYKIYIIDEVHMLSNNAFNALLKTLEEPPEHVKFIFATTETRRVPVTVLSRCQRFDLRRVDAEALSTHFAQVAAKEGASIGDGALGLIARAADGSVRDGLSLLDQAIAHAAGEVTEDIVRDMLGLADGARIYDLYEAVMKGAVADALDIFADLYASGADPAVVLQDMLEITHWLTRLKMAPKAADAAAVSENDRMRGTALAEALAVPTLGRAWQMLLKGLGEVRVAPSAVQAAEMVLIRLTHVADLPSPADVIRQVRDGAPAGTTAPQAAPAAPPTPAPVAAAPEPPMPIAEPEPPQETAPRAEAVGPRDFEAVVALFEAHREMLLHACLVNQVHLVRFEPGHIALRAADGAPDDLAMRVSRMLSDWTEMQWLVSLSNEPGEPTLGTRRAEAAEQRRGVAIGHPLVQAALETFPGATVETVLEHEPAAPDADDAMVAPIEDDEIDDEEMMR
ncbi:MAG: DNA polymerase III subunit gamma/tau [Alphaproteobacteria bacterium]